MLLLWLTLVASAGSMRAIVEVGPDGTRVVELHETAAAPDALPPGPLAVVDDEGRVLATTGVPDPRVRSVLTPDGGRGTRLDRGRIDVVLDWPETAVAVRAGGLEVRPGSPRTAVGGAVQVVGNGPSEERLDLVFVSEGYTEAELDQFADDVDWIVAYLLGIEPYASYADLFNIWRVELPSASSGADHPGAGTDVDTALGCAYECRGIDELICCDGTAVMDAVLGSVPDAEGVIVLVNDPVYGGSGGFDFAVSYTGRTDGHQVAAHELGHSLVQLWDEYSYGTAGDPLDHGPNCTADAEVPWPEWVGTEGVDAFQDCSYTTHRRPTANGCMMRTLSDGYCPVCRQEVVRAIYRELPRMTAGTDPLPGPVAPGTAIAVDTFLPAERLDFQWLVDGKRVGSDPTYTVPADGLGGKLTLTLSDPTDFVRADPDGLLVDYIGPWTDVDPTEPTGSEEAPKACGCATGAPPGPLGWLTLLVLLARRRP